MKIIVSTTKKVSVSVDRLLQIFRHAPLLNPSDMLFRITLLPSYGQYNIAKLAEK